MALPLSQAERSTYRSTIKVLTDYQTRLENSLKRGLRIPLPVLQRLHTRYLTSDPAKQLEAMSEELQTTSETYLSRLREMAPESLSAFVEFMTPEEPPALHHEFFCDKLELIERRDILRATFSCPPGHAKTKFCSRYFPAWYLGRNKNHRYLQGGHSQNFAENEFGKYVRDILADPRYQEVFPGVGLHPRSTAAGSWRINHTRAGGYVAKGVGQSIAGYRGHCGGIDDPFGTREDAQSEAIRNKVGNWLFTDFSTRMLPGAPMFIIATRWHMDDLIGRVEEHSRNKVGIPWEIFNLSAIIETEDEMACDPMGRSMGEVLWPDFYGVEEILNFKATLPAADWHALYKGRPRDEDGNVVKATWFRRYNRLPAVHYPGSNSNPTNDPSQRLRRVTISVDCANKDTARANPTVIGVWYEDMSRRHYLAEVVRKKMEFNTMVRMVETKAAEHGATAILVEDAGAGTQFLQQRAGLAPAPLIACATGNKSKEFRFDGVTPMIEGGEVFLPYASPWLTEYESELLAFPNAGTDDQVDMTSQYLAWARARGNYGTRRLKTGQSGGKR